MPLEASIFADSQLNVDDSIVEVDLETKVFVDLDCSDRKSGLVNDHFILDLDVECEVLVKESDDLLDGETVENDDGFKHLLNFSLLFWSLGQRSQQLFIKVVVFSPS